jgi:hypothetical protein
VSADRDPWVRFDEAFPAARHGEPLLTPLTRTMLEAVTGDPDDSDLVLRATCHPLAGLRASYDSKAGTLTLSCEACDRLVAAVVVQR